MIYEITPVYCESVPDDLEEGRIYISDRFKMAIHLCACGCKHQTATPIREDGWTLTDNAGIITLRPSIGNFKGENPYHAHYFITNNKIEWC